MTYDVQKFFDDIFGKDQINFSCIKGKLVQKFSGPYNEQTIAFLNHYNAQDYECYFVVNSGGYKAQDIKTINAVYIDLDCGKDENGNYFPLSKVERYKREKLEQIHQFAKQPTYIIDTRNGLHVYWLLEPGARIEAFEVCVENLIRYFQADSHAKNVNRLLRVPNTYWCKDIDHKYLTTIIEHNEVRYSIDKLLESIPEIVIKSHGTGNGNTNRKKCSSLLPVTGTKTSSESGNVDFIRTQQIDVLQAILKPDRFVASSDKEVFEYLKQQELQRYLGVQGKRFSCVFHDDENPSAGIFQTESGHYMYKCHSESCGVHGTIIELTQRIIGTKDLAKVMRFLRKVYRIEFSTNEWKKSWHNIYESNLQLLHSDQFRQGYEALYQRIKNYLPILEAMNELAKQHVITQNFSDQQGRPVFYASIGYIASLVGKTEYQHKQVTNVIALLTYLGLVNKLSVADIPEHMLRTARHEAAKKKQTKLISFYSIPKYDLKTLDFATTKALEFKALGFTMKGWSRELLLRTLGEAEANRVYPQEQGKELPILNEQVAQQIELVVLTLISEKGWTTEQEIQSYIKLRFKGQQQYIQKQIKRVLPDIINKYCLVRVRLNKQFKEELNINQKGFPFVILKENDHEQAERKQTKVYGTMLQTSFNNTSGNTIG